VVEPQWKGGKEGGDGERGSGEAEGKINAAEGLTMEFWMMAMEMGWKGDGDGDGEVGK
jgi:hypothetical protein